MFIVKVTGGLGNQMFQYIFGQYLSKKFNVEVQYDVSSFDYQPAFLDERKLELDNFNLNIKIVNSDLFNKRTKFQFLISGILQILSGSNKTMLPVSEKLTDFSFYLPAYIKNRYYIGYWQSEKFFLGSCIDLQRDFSLKEEIAKTQLINQSQKLSILNSNSVALQVRRGDYLNVGNVICDTEYYRKSIKHILENVQNPVFFVFSDDIDWCKSKLKLGVDLIFIEPNLQLPFEDMHLMSCCKHNIIVNSTYGWWGAKLNASADSIKIAPIKWQHPLNSKEFIRF
jgi:hypothetical protein